ncbi:MAG: MlaA family lipoprotein [Limisphaerales bacterium]
MQSIRKIQTIALMLLSLSVASGAEAQPQQAGAVTNAATETFALPKSVPDPIEPFNRLMWGFNKSFMTDVIRPTSRVYRFVVRKPVRTGIGNFGKNLTYPGRLLNNMLQGKWAGAGAESRRFFVNTTFGVAGFFDIASKRGIPKSEADFGQTFGQWGWDPKCYLMLPFLGPSNERDAVGWAADTASNPLVYVTPYSFDINNPLTYFGVYSYFTYAVMYNDLSDSVGEFVRFSRAEMDPYSEIQYAWTFARKNRVANFEVKGKQDEASLETLESVFFTYKDPNFPHIGKTRSVKIPATGRKLKFTYWLQPKPAPVVYLVPGIGSHRMAQTSLALAELVHSNGFSVVCVSSAFNSEFMEHASTAALPGYLPVDGHDLHVALSVIDARLRKQYPNHLGDKALMGYSMGALHSLFVAATEPTNTLVHFDRYVAINTPVRMLQGIGKLDEFYRAPLKWPAAERTDNIENTFLKVAALSKSTLTPQITLPFNEIESKFLIGLTFRLILRDVIYSSQKRNNQYILQQPLRNFRRDPVYREILQYSYKDYFEKFASPYYQSKGIGSTAGEALEKAGDLRTYERELAANPNVRIIVNHNDFLLTEKDVAWFHATFAPEQLTIFTEGGHLGNLFNPVVQKSILEALGGLKSSTKSN